MIQKTTIYLMLLFGFAISTAQIGINAPDPDATLDIRATNTATPANNDGLLIPRVDEFPVTPPAAEQDALLIFVTGAGSASRGFYYWDNGASNWTVINTGASGPINGVIAGDGLTGGATSGTATIDVVAANGLTTNANEVVLGGTLDRGTLLNLSTYDFITNLNSTGKFLIQSNGTNKFELEQNGGAKFADGLSIGTIGNGVYSLAIANSTPSILIGNGGTTFNQVESGRLTFEENASLYNIDFNTYCGFEFRNDGAINTLYLSSACPSENKIMTFQRSGNIGIATDSPTAELSVNGAANKPGGGDWAVFSDRRLKKDVSTYEEGLDLIMNVNPVNFTYNQTYFDNFGGGKELRTKVFQGVIAQELQQIAPDMVRVVNQAVDNSSDLDGGSPAPKGGEFLEVDTSKFTFALINSVKQQQKQIEQQNKKIEELTALVNELANSIKK